MDRVCNQSLISERRSRLPGIFPKEKEPPPTLHLVDVENGVGMQCSRGMILFPNEMIAATIIKYFSVLSPGLCFICNDLLSSLQHPVMELLLLHPFYRGEN